MLVTGGCRFTADGCTFEDNAQATETTSRHAGLLGDGNLSFTVRNCVFQRQSTGYGLATSLATDVTQCVFKSNHIGVALLRCNTPLAFSNCVITANRIGVYGEDSNVAITPLTMDNSLPVDNDFNIYLTKGQYEISDITLRRGIVEDLTAVGSSLTVSNSTFRDSGVGMVAWSCPFIEATGCHFSNNSQLGVKLAGRAALKTVRSRITAATGGFADLLHPRQPN
ncbi:MAG: right-handed parallel beta-helix repeat-containing protein [Pirellulaceae bacterium]